MEEEEKEQAFTVTDRRTTSAEGPAEPEKKSAVEKEAPAENKEKITDNAEFRNQVILPSQVLESPRRVRKVNVCIARFWFRFDRQFFWQ